MITIRDLRYARFNSSVARSALALFYRSGHAYRLCFGPLRGLQMHYDSSVNFHSILGLWDTDTLSFLDAVLIKSGLLAKDAVAADVGANIGYYSMWLSTVAVGGGQIYSFEPNPDVAACLSKNLKLNNINNAKIIDMACGDHLGTTDFFIADHHHASSIHAAWAGRESGTARKITVPVTTLDAFFAPQTGHRPPAFIKIDIEGGGTHALPGCRNILSDVRPYILIESHTVDEDRAISNVLTQFNYRGYRLTDRKWVEKAEAVHPDKNGVWGTLFLTPREWSAPVEAAIKRL
jgi:FkbM family methyltransferase